ncbi:MAG: AMP-binding protein [Rhodobacteraceae bacterium]|nr:AMP-binding protein [Paracoccaceae bacterium]
MANHLFDSLTRAREVDSTHPFAIVPGRQPLEYGRFYRDAGRAAAALIANGITPGARVAVQAEKSVTVLAAYLGTIAAGGVFFPMNPAYTDEEVEFLLKDARPSLLVCDPERIESLRGIAEAAGVERVFSLDREGIGCFRDLIENAPVAPAVERSASDLAAILYTSGTTGRPKGAMLSHSALAANSQSLKTLWQFGGDDCLIHALPVYHTHGLFVATNVALMAGCTLRFFQKFVAGEIIDAFATATAMMGIPTFFSRLLGHQELNREAAAGMRLFISGSAPLPAELHRRWTRRTGHRILERYGMTEANMICSIPYEGPRKPGAVGRPLPDTEIRIRDLESGAVVGGGAGMLEVRGPGLFSGYWRNPRKTAQEFTADGYFITGDIACLDEDDFVVIEGRARDLVISGGVNIYPKEIEQAIEEIPGVKECAVIGVPHPDLGEAVVAVLTADEPESFTLEAVRENLAGRLARFKHPKQVLVQSELPRNSMGKIQKNRLRDALGQLFSE